MAKHPKLRTLLTRRDQLLPLLQGCAVFLVCLIALISAVTYIDSVGRYRTDYTPDEGNYIEMARRLLSEHIYSYWGNGSDAYVSPGFPLFLTACMALFGTGLEALYHIKLVQCVLAALTVFLTFLLGRLLTDKYSVGLIAAILVCAYRPFYAYSQYLLTENFYYFTMMLFFVVFVLAVQREKLWLHLLSGVCFAVTVMVRPLVFVTLPFLYLPLLVRFWKQWRQFFRPFLLFLAGFAAVCLPWWIRNLVVLGQFIPLATQTNPIFAGLAPDVAALGLRDPGSFLGNLQLLFQLLRDDFFGTLYWMTFGKFAVIFMHGVEMRPTAILTFLQNAVVVLGLCGGIRALFTRRYWGPALVFWVYLASSFLFIPTQRYALQYIPFLGILTGWFLTLAFSSQDSPSDPPRGFTHKPYTGRPNRS